MNEDTIILEWLRSLFNCMYISDLRNQKYDKLISSLRNQGKNYGFSEKQWYDALLYIHSSLIK